MAINLEIRHLKTLRALEETDSLVKMLRMFLTQSALSHQIKDLEERIGSPYLSNLNPFDSLQLGRDC